MTQSVSAACLSALSEFVALQMGLCFPPQRWRDLERGICAVARELGFQEVESSIQWLLSAPLSRTQVELIASHLTVGETYFFRDKKVFEAMKTEILPRWVRSRRKTSPQMRIWSAGCATGEEPYSIAIVLNEILPDRKDWHISILATDINPQFLRKAAQGVYSEWSFRETPDWIRDKYFRRRKDGRFEILPSLREMVVFSYLNLAADPFPSLLTNTNAMDMIFCRNVLMYFAEEQSKKVIENFHHSLLESGWLILSPTETSLALNSSFVAVDCSRVPLFRKESTRGNPPRDLQTDLAVEPEISSPTTFNRIEELSSTGDAVASPSGLFPEAGSEARELSPAILAAEIAPGEWDHGEGPLQGEEYQPASPQDTPEARVLLARSCADQGKLSEALSWCDRAIAVDPLNANAHYLRAAILLEQGTLDEARHSLQRALYLDADFVLAHFVLGNLAVRQGRVAESEKHFDNARSILRAYRSEDILPESDGMTAGRMLEIIQSTTAQERAA